MSLLLSVMLDGRACTDDNKQWPDPCDGTIELFNPEHAILPALSYSCSLIALLTVFSFTLSRSIAS